MSKSTVGYYQFDNEEFSVAIVLKEQWENHKCLSDSGEEEKFIPEGFFNLTDAIYEHTYSTTDQAREALNNVGFVESKLFDL